MYHASSDFQTALGVTCREEKLSRPKFPQVIQECQFTKTGGLFPKPGVSQWARLKGWYLFKLELWECRDWATFFFLHPGSIYYVEDAQLMLGRSAQMTSNRSQFWKVL